MTETIRLGNVVKDRVSGFVGFVTMKAETLSGMVQYAIQAKAAEGAEKMPDQVFVDEHMLMVVEPGLADELPPTDDTVTLKLGEEAIDKVTGMIGILTEKITFQNGCVYFYLKSRKLNKSGEIVGAQIPHKLLERIGKGLEKEESLKKAAVKRTGGPMRTVANRTAPRR